MIIEKVYVNRICRQTLGDDIRQVQWRTKQNLDFAYLMMYAQKRGKYYLQLVNFSVIASFATKLCYSLDQRFPTWGTLTPRGTPNFH